jgi:hypothetical protein
MREVNKDADKKNAASGRGRTTPAVDRSRISGVCDFDLAAY